MWVGVRVVLRVDSDMAALAVGALAVGALAAWTGSVGLLAAAVALAVEAAWQAGQEWECEIVIQFPLLPTPLWRAAARLRRAAKKK